MIRIKQRGGSRKRVNNGLCQTIKSKEQKPILNPSCKRLSRCWKSHYHVPQSAIAALMKVFANMESLKIKLCLFPFSQANGEGMSDKMHDVVQKVRWGIDQNKGRHLWILNSWPCFLFLIINTRVNESWLKNLQNLVYWLKKHEENKHQLGEKLWLVYKWEGERCNVNKLFVKERDVEELLGLLKRTGTTTMKNNENAGFF